MKISTTLAIFELPIRNSGCAYQEGKKIGWGDGMRAIFAILWLDAPHSICVEHASGIRILGRLNRAPRFSNCIADVLLP